MQLFVSGAVWLSPSRIQKKNTLDRFRSNEKSWTDQSYSPETASVVSMAQTVSNTPSHKSAVLDSILPNMTGPTVAPPPAKYSCHRAMVKLVMEVVHLIFRTLPPLRWHCLRSQSHLRDLI